MPLTCQFYNIDLSELSCDDRASLGCQIKARMTRKSFFLSFFRFNKCFNFHSQIDPGGQTQLLSFLHLFSLSSRCSAVAEQSTHNPRLLGLNPAIGGTCGLYYKSFTIVIYDHITV